MRLNSVLVEGQITRPVEFSKMGDGTPVARFTLKCVDGNERSFLPVSCIGHAAEKAVVMRANDIVFVRGRLRQERWDSAGTPHSKVVIYADGVRLIKEAS